jgi:uncharacterized protein YecE (DUF72 family)
MHRIEIGCQGWNYPDWVSKVGEPVFYPVGTKPAHMLELYTKVFDTTEIDSTFYGVPTEQTVEGWYRRTPDHFTFSAKMPQEITHQYMLRRPSREVLVEFCNRIRLLAEKLVCVLIQMPPSFDPSMENFRALSEFLPLLPSDIRFAIEFRASGWFEKSVVDLLIKHRVTPALVEGPWIRESEYRSIEVAEFDLFYIRWMGERDLVKFDRVQRNMDRNLQHWAANIRALQTEKAVFAYFSNFYEGYAVESANKLRRLLGQSPVDAETLSDQPSLF